MIDIEFDEMPVPVKQAAGALGLPYWKVQRAVKSGLLAHYTLQNSRKLVKVSELRELILSSRKGGQS